ncbi:MAG: HAMP domain-containing protein [Dictyoglomus sp.]
MKGPKRMQDFAITIIFIAFISSMVFAGIFSRSMGRRIAILNKAVNEISHGNWDLNIPLQGKDEIGELSENVKMMARNIKNLNELIIKQKDMKFKTLMEQLNPHFLFNTLETIQKILSEDQENYSKIGLKNTLERIKLFYGNGYGLKIETQKNVGTKVDIILPYATLRKERVDV